MQHLRRWLSAVACAAALAGPAAAGSQAAEPTALPELRLTDAQVTERSGGELAYVKVRAVLSQASATDVTFRPDPRVEGRSGLLTWPVTIPAGTTSLAFDVAAVGDDQFEVGETYLLDAMYLSGAVMKRRGRIVVLNDDVPPVMALRDDRFRVAENGAVVVDFRANDLYTQYGDGFRIVVPPANGQAVLQTQGTVSTWDDRIAYTAPADWSGEERLVYEFCYGGEHCRRASVAFVVAPTGRLAWNTEAHGGFRDTTLSGLRALPSARFSTTPFVEPSATIERTLDATGAGLTIDALDPFVNPGPARSVELHTIAPPADGQPVAWRVVAREHGYAVDLYLGIDDDGDGQPSRAELRCAWTMDHEPCEFAMSQAPGETLRYWTMVHAVGSNSTTPVSSLTLWEVPLHPGTTDVVATGPGHVDAGASFPMRLVWRDLSPSMAPRQGFVQLRASADAEPALIPVSLERVEYRPAPRLLRNGETVSLRAHGDDENRAFIDLPPGVTRLTATTRNSTGELGLELVEQPYWDANYSEVDAPGIEVPRVEADTPGGNETIQLTAPRIREGRWYLVVKTPPYPGPVDFDLTVTFEAAQAPVPPGSYYNPYRPGHGLFLYPAGPDWAGIWYTYLQDGTATWYWLQGRAPSADGVWRGRIYRAAWNGTSNLLTEIGEATVTPGTAEVPAFRFSYVLDGLTASEPMFLLGSGCPSLAGAPVDVSTHWFNPATAGTGYSVQMWPDYEFFAAFVYDRLGVPRFLTAERQGFGGGSSEFALLQTHGFCPTCAKTAPERLTVGLFRRDLQSDGRLRFVIDGIFGDGVPGVWSVDEIAQTLGGPGTTQGCAP